jgi:hypothetical protein
MGKAKPPPNWGTRKEGMARGRWGSTTMNALMHDGKIRAKKLGKKVIVDLNSVDSYIESLPDVPPSTKRRVNA